MVFIKIYIIFIGNLLGDLSGDQGDDTFEVLRIGTDSMCKKSVKTFETIILIK